MNLTIVDIEAFKEDVGLDYQTLKELYMTFIEELQSEKEAVNKHLTINEVGNLRKAVHNIKGIASSYRTKRVFEQAKNLDVKLKFEDFNDLNNYVRELNQGIEEAVREITKYFEAEEISA